MRGRNGAGVVARAAAYEVALCLVAGRVAVGCTTTTLAPLPEAIVIVDTDVSVPQLASRLRVDAFAEDGTWYSSRDFGRPRPSDWPLSFGVYSPDPASSRKVLLRLRAYTDGAVRSYEGERYAPRPTPSSGPPFALAPLPPPPPGSAPRLLDAAGRDVTPPTEPAPLLAIDRLAIIQIDPGAAGQVRVVLRGDCIGTMADIAGLQTCVDTENARVDVPTVTPAGTLGAPAPASKVGAFGKPVACTATPRGPHTDPSGTPLFDEEVCVPGGTFVFGSASQLGTERSDGTPERVAIVDPFLIDKYEVTVARWRQAMRDGLKEAPVANDAAFPTDPSATLDTSSSAFCTYSDTPLGRETFPVSCVTWAQARAFCRHDGGDLPFEAQWEYVAAAAGRAIKTAYPWGGPDDATPTCDRTVVGRFLVADGVPGLCMARGLGPLPVDAYDRPSGDVSVAFGVVDLGGNVGEFMRDNAESLGSYCWMEQGLHNPRCEEVGSPWVATRGAAWQGFLTPYADVRSYFATAQGGDFAPSSGQLGFRCVRSGAP